MSPIHDWSSVGLEQLALAPEYHDGAIVLGLDGIVDNVWTVIRKRLDIRNAEPFTTMKEFGESILERSGTGLSHEILIKRCNAGGFTANTGLALGRLGIRASLIGMYGSEAIHEAFGELSAYCQLSSLGPPATCHILEFQDGKLMLPHLEGLVGVDWSMIVHGFGIEKLRELVRDARILSIGYWSNMPYFDDILKEFRDEIFSGVPLEWLFFDFGNVAKRGQTELMDTLRLLGSIDDTIPVVLSLNDAEAKVLFRCYNEALSDDVGVVAQSVTSLRNRLDISEIVVHTTQFAVAANQDKIEVLNQDFCQQPVRTTGAGDTFNAGYMVALLNELPLQERLAVANATTSFFVRNGYPPDQKQLYAELGRIAAKLGGQS